MSTREDGTVSEFYNSCGGWNVSADLNTRDALLFEDLRNVSKTYLKSIRLRVNKYISVGSGERILDFASGPIQYPEYLTYSSRFAKRFCVDYSGQALHQAEQILGTRGEYYRGDYLELNFPDNYFDCILCIHTLYHVDAAEQVRAVNQLINQARPGSNILIIYSNPDSLNMRMRRMAKSLGWKSSKSPLDLYFHAHPISWWNQFRSTCDVKIYTWRTFEASIMKLLIPQNIIGSSILKILYLLETLNLPLYTQLSDYPMIILRKL